MAGSWAVAVYVPVSTEEQRERQTIATQREGGERYCQLHGLSVYRLYADDGVSGTVPLERRPDGSQILRESRLGKVRSTASVFRHSWSDLR
jgi:site-specific DNA recombinase